MRFEGGFEIEAPPEKVWESFEVKNRLVMSSVTSGLGDHTGAKTKRNTAFLERLTC